MVGDAVREDAVAATLLICEVAAKQKQKWEAPFTKNCNCMKNGFTRVLSFANQKRH
jgi:hypothetical protein